MLSSCNLISVSFYLLSLTVARRFTKLFNYADQISRSKSIIFFGGFAVRPPSLFSPTSGDRVPRVKISIFIYDNTLQDQKDMSSDHDMDEAERVRQARWQSKEIRSIVPFTKKGSKYSLAKDEFDDDTLLEQMLNTDSNFEKESNQSHRLQTISSGGAGGDGSIYDTNYSELVTGNEGPNDDILEGNEGPNDDVVEGHEAPNDDV